MADVDFKGSRAYFSFLVATRSARKNSGRRGIEYLLTEADIAAMWQRCKGRCEVSGIEFDLAHEGPNLRRPYAPSVDRLDSAKGYTPENTRVVCVAVNLAMNAWGEAVLLRITSAMLETGAFYRIGRNDTAPARLPIGVRVYAGKRGIAYYARGRDFGREEHLGVFQTVQDAIDARLAWARKHLSLKVIQEVFAFTRNPELLNEINNMR